MNSLISANDNTSDGLETRIIESKFTTGGDDYLFYQ